MNLRRPVKVLMVIPKEAGGCWGGDVLASPGRFRDGETRRQGDSCLAAPSMGVLGIPWGGRAGQPQAGRPAWRFHQPTVSPCPQQPRTPVSIFLGKTCHQQRGGPAVAQGPGPGETTARGGGDAGFPFRLVEAPGAPGATWGPVRPQACPAVYLPLLVPSALGGPRTAHGLGLRAVYELQQVLHPAMVREYPLEEEMAPHSSLLAWRILGTEEPGGLQSVGLWSESETQRKPEVPASPRGRIMFFIM